MIVRDIMATKLITVEPDDTLAHAANLLRQHQFHHLPVTLKIHLAGEQGGRTTLLSCEGMLSSQDIDLAVAIGRQGASSDALQRPWQERRVVEVMHRAAIRITSTASVSAAVQILIDRGLNGLPVVEYKEINEEVRTILVGLVTRSDLLIALSRAMGAFEPGMQLDIALPLGDMSPLAQALGLAAELQVHIRSVIAAPQADGTLDVATLRLGTINPAPFLRRLQDAGIHYSFGNPLLDED